MTSAIKIYFLNSIFSWIIPFLWRGSKKEIKEDDVYKVLPDDESKYLGDLLDK